MRRWLIFTAMTTTVVALTHDVSAAEPEASPPPPPVEQAELPGKRTLLVEGAAGMGTPLGWLGASAIVSPIPELALHAGIGIGSQSLQISAGLRGRIRTTGRNFISIGASWSTGQHAVVGQSPLPNMAYAGEPIWFWRHAHIMNIDGSFEHDAGSVVLRPFVGLGYVVNGADALRSHEIKSQTCPGCGPDFFAKVIPYIGFAVAFGVL